MKRVILIVVLFFSMRAVQSQWTAQASGTTNQLRSIHFANEDTGVVVGFSGTILRTVNGGTNWNAVTSGTTNNLNGVKFVTDDIVIAVGGNTIPAEGTILRSTNGGGSWTVTTLGTSYFMSVWFVNSTTGYICGGNGVIYKSTDAGLNWAPQSSGVVAELTAINFVDENNGFAVGQNASILKTTNGGTNWTSLANSPFGSSDGFLSAFGFDANNYIIAGSYGNMCKTTNGGTNWVEVNQSETNFISAIDFTDVSNGQYVGGGGSIKKSTDAGSNWVSITSSTTNGLRGLCLVNSELGYAAGLSGTILKYVAPALSIATLSTNSVTNITDSSAQSGGNITDDGGASITARGVCWNTTGSPTVANDKTADGTGSGSFSSLLSGLIDSTTYYVRAYATNSVGTAYGSEISFTTLKTNEEDTTIGINENAVQVPKVLSPALQVLVIKDIKKSIADIRIFDISGEQMYYQQNPIINNDVVFIPISNLIKGMYVVSIDGKGYKFIKD